MGELILIQKNGELNLNSKNPYRIVTKAEHRQVLLSEDVVNISLDSKAPIDFHLGDKIEYAGRFFLLNTPPRIKREQGVYNYELTFEGVQYSLRKKIYFNIDKTGFQTTADFPLTGEIDIFLKTLVNNINSVEGNRWILGEYPQNTDTKTLTFNNENCLAVLQKICSEYQSEFEILENTLENTCTLNIKSIGTKLNHTFEYGKGNGLYSLSRSNEADDVITRLYAFGSSENIPHDYRNYSDRLKMPQSVGNFIENQEKINLYGYKEGVKIFEEIKPTFKGIISKVGKFNDLEKYQEIEVSNMDFDLNEKDNEGNTKYLIAETSAKLHINKGNLAGYQFELKKYEGYNHKTKTFKVKQFTDTSGQKFPTPNTIYQFSVGDEFTLIDIVMPEIYITRAEKKLHEQALKEYEKISKNNLKYTLDIDPLFLKNKGDKNSVFFKIGDYIHLKDEDLNINKESRIISLTRDLLNPFKYTLDIADTYEVSFTISVLNDIKDTKKLVLSQKEVARQNYQNSYRNLQELRDNIFDTDNHFDAEKIRPNSIETNMLSVGAKNQHFTLENVTLNPNTNGRDSHTTITAGKLVHFSIDDKIREWSLLEANVQNLKNLVYYVYAKVERIGKNGSWLITTDKIKFDQNPQYFHFLCYLLYTPKDGKREAEAMYGNVLMHGGQITAGRIKSTNGQTYFDLDTGEITGKISFTKDSPALDQVKDPRIPTLIEKTNFLRTTAVEGNTIATGNIVLGNDLGINSGITGMGDNTDVFLWGGADYSKKDTAPLSLHRDGFMRVRDGKGNVIFEIGQKDGKAVFNIYNENGDLQAKIGNAGLQYIGYSPESYTKIYLHRTAFSYNDDDAIIKYLKEKLVIVGEEGEDRSDRTASIVVNGGSFFYSYSAGKNFEAEANKQYENILFLEENKLGERAFSGTYIYISFPQKVHKPIDFEPEQGVLLPIDIYDVINGQIIRSRTLTLKINRKDWNYDYSDFYNSNH